MKNNIQFWTIEKFFERLEYLLKRKGWTLNKLSVEADMSCSSIYQMKSRNSFPSFFTLCNICDALDITLEEFFETGKIQNFDIQKVCSDFKQLSDEKKLIIVHLLEQFK